jgi:hypothetical protein
MRLLLLLFTIIINLQLSAAGNMPREKILWVAVDEIGTITVGGDTISSDDLARYIQERLFKSYVGTGEMHDKIKFSKKTDAVPDMVAEVVIKEIQEGQRRALTELCLEKYRALFENIEKRKQEKLKKQFPVLFQTSYL